MITIYTTCRSFYHPIFGVVQHNAILSWLQLTPQPQVIVLGDAPGAERFCCQAGIQFVPDVPTRASGVPLQNEMSKIAESLSLYDTMLYLSSDMILMDSNTYIAVNTLRRDMGTYVASVARYNTDLHEQIDFSANWKQKLLQSKLTSNVTCGDYFLYSKGFFEHMPPFAVGRGFTDFWMHHYAQQKTRLVDATDLVIAVHQNHGHSHVGGVDNMATNEDFLQNQQLCGGEWVVW